MTGDLGDWIERIYAIRWRALGVFILGAAIVAGWIAFGVVQ